MAKRRKEPWRVPRGAKRICVGPFERVNTGGVGLSAHAQAEAARWGLAYADPANLTDFNIITGNRGLTIEQSWLYYTDHDRSRWSQHESPLEIRYPS
jgi:hypothetical protein